MSARRINNPEKSLKPSGGVDKLTSSSGLYAAGRGGLIVATLAALDAIPVVRSVPATQQQQPDLPRWGGHKSRLKRVAEPGKGHLFATTPQTLPPSMSRAAGPHSGQERITAAIRSARTGTMSQCGPQICSGQVGGFVPIHLSTVAKMYDCPYQSHLGTGVASSIRSGRRRPEAPTSPLTVATDSGAVPNSQAAAGVHEERRSFPAATPADAYRHPSHAIAPQDSIGLADQIAASEQRSRELWRRLHEGWAHRPEKEDPSFGAFKRRFVDIKQELKVEEQRRKAWSGK